MFKRYFPDEVVGLYSFSFLFSKFSSEWRTNARLSFIFSLIENVDISLISRNASFNFPSRYFFSFSNSFALSLRLLYFLAVSSNLVHSFISLPISSLSIKVSFKLFSITTDLLCLRFDPTWDIVFLPWISSWIIIFSVGISSGIFFKVFSWKKRLFFLILGKELSIWSFAISFINDNYDENALLFMMEQHLIQPDILLN